MSNDLILRGADLQQVTCIVQGANYASEGMLCDSIQRNPVIQYFLVGIRGISCSLRAGIRGNPDREI